MARSKIMLSEAIDEYLRRLTATRKAEATVKALRSTLGRMLRHVGDLQMANLKASHLEDWFYGPTGLTSAHKTMRNARTGVVTIHPPISEVTHNGYRARLKMFLEWSAQRGYSRGAGLLLENITPMKEPAKIRQRPAPVTLLALLDAADNPRDRCWIAMGLNTALRSNEMRRVQVGDLDLTAGYFAATITKTSDTDEVPITADLDAELRRWMARYAEDLGRPLEPDDYLFPPMSGRPFSHISGYDEEGNAVMERVPSNWLPDRMMTRTEQMVKNAMARLGLTTRYEGTHTIRRAVALAYFEQVSKERGDVAALRETSALLHHKSLATTEKYLGMTAEKHRRNLRMVGKPFLTAMVEAENVVPLRAVGQAD